MASTLRRAQSEFPEDQWSNETSVDPKLRRVDLGLRRDQFSSKRPSLGRRASRAVVRFLITFCLGVAAAFAWQSYGDAAKEMIARFAEWQGCDPESVGADTTYGNGEFLQWLMERDITPYIHTRENGPRKKSLLYGPERFTYLPESNSYLCPAGQQLNYGGHNARNRTHVYIGTRKRCGGCAQKTQCTRSPLKYLAIHVQEPARQRARDLVNTPAFVQAQRQRKKVEALFAELKNQIGLRRLRLRRLKFVREQFFLAAAAQNIKRLVRFLSQGPRPPLAVSN